MNQHYKSYLLITGILLLSYACTYNKGETVNPAGCTTVIENVSFSVDVQPVLTTNCASAGCHSGNTPEGNLNLEASKSYAALSKPGKGYIDTDNPHYSVLYSSMVSTSDPMPPVGRQPLSACDMKKIEVWMKEGALDN
ncbi:c-type cytochrome domain-containing protein [Cytophaga aurantiaca]|uniref:c-type cytochrome domain-containing protein n=1 Tax=Cytophaga aurantiaca TaxID=29530 RepID=UPI00036EF34D|nr:c-type cytochrome domain-containing protein [Cytophaga aurantiaca]